LQENPAPEWLSRVAKSSGMLAPAGPWMMPMQSSAPDPVLPPAGRRPGGDDGQAWAGVMSEAALEVTA
jgi:hypothetical protein